MKKRVLFATLGLLIFTFITFGTKVVSAQPFGFPSSFDYMVEGVWRNIQIILMFILGGNDIYSGELLFIKFLIFLLITVITITTLKRVPNFGENERISRVVGLIVGLLATRFLTTETLVNLIWLPYGALGIAISSLLPPIIFFFLVQSFESSVLRKVLWVCFVVIFFGIWIYRFSDIGDLSWIYFLSGIASVIFLFADGTIRRTMINQQMKELGIDNRSTFEREILRQMRQTDEDLNNNIINSSQHRRIMGKLRKKLEAIRKN